MNEQYVPPHERYEPFRSAVMRFVAWYQRLGKRMDKPIAACTLADVDTAVFEELNNHVNDIYQTGVAAMTRPPQEEPNEPETSEDTEKVQPPMGPKPAPSKEVLDKEQKTSKK